jgi:hypothetical protein
MVLHIFISAGAFHGPKQRFMSLSSDAAGGAFRHADAGMCAVLLLIAGIVPTTNPTSTVIFKCLLALKTR